MSLSSYLITGGGGAASEAIFRLMSHKYSMHFADADIATIPISIDDKFRHAIPYANDSNYISEIVALCNKNDIGVVVPAVDEELLYMHALEKENSHLQIMAPGYEYSKVMLDKLTSMQFLGSLGIPVPKTVLLKDAESLVFPCIAKPRSGRGSQDVFILNNIESISAYSQLTGVLENEAVAQELLVGDEYTVTMVADGKGELREIIPVFVEQKRGITIRARIDDNKLVVNACRLIHQEAPTKATYNIQLILTKDGEVMPFEINPRISTTLCLIIAAGIDPFAAFFGKDDIGTVNKGKMLQRYWLNNFSS